MKLILFMVRLFMMCVGAMFDRCWRLCEGWR